MTPSVIPRANPTSGDNNCDVDGEEEEHSLILPVAPPPAILSIGPVASVLSLDNRETGGGDVVSEYNPKHNELSIMVRMFASGKDLAQYTSSESKARCSAVISMRDWSVEIKKPSLVHSLCWAL